MGRTKLSLILILICVVKCLTMSSNELEDFADYLEKTSQLSPTLKKGVEPDDYDDDEIVSDHAWEESGKFEGDLILNDRQRRLIVQNVAEGLSRNGISDDTKRWPNNEVIYYIQIEHFTSDQVQAIQSGIDDLARVSCVKFRHYRKGDRDAVVIQGARKGCFSQVGYQGGFQVLNLSGRHPVGRGCFRHGTVVHELLHTLGFYHMQSSPDRDDYVNIVWENIVQAAKHNFRKYNSFSVSDFGVGYDYDSVLHYSRRAFSANGQDTIVPKKSGAEIGQRLGLSDKDTQKLNRMYCDADPDHVEASDDAPKNNRKKSIKNKPFEGHGIGYHQGKAVVIKLLPAPETYKLRDVPSSHIFDYFSKAPQILPSSRPESFRANKEIAYAYNPSELVLTQKYKAPGDYHRVPEIEFHDKRTDPKYQGHDIFAVNKHNKDDILNKKTTEIKNIKNSAGEIADDGRDETQDPSLIEAVDRLSKIIKSHVYPSQNPDFSIYKKYEQDSERDSDRQEVKKENGLNVAPIRQYITQGEKLQSAMRFINNLFDSNSYRNDRTLDGKFQPATTTSDDYYNYKPERRNKEGVLVRDNIIDSPYILSDKNEKKHTTLAPTDETSKYDKYSSKLRDSKNNHDNHETWHEKYLWHKSNPTHSDKESYTDYFNREYGDHYSDHSSLVPRRINNYLYLS